MVGTPRRAAPPYRPSRRFVGWRKGAPSRRAHHDFATDPSCLEFNPVNRLPSAAAADVPEDDGSVGPDNSFAHDAAMVNPVPAMTEGRPADSPDAMDHATVGANHPLPHGAAGHVFGQGRRPQAGIAKAHRVRGSRRQQRQYQQSCKRKCQPSHPSSLPIEQCLTTTKSDRCSSDGADHYSVALRICSASRVACTSSQRRCERQPVPRANKGRTLILHFAASICRSSRRGDIMTLHDAAAA